MPERRCEPPHRLDAETERVREAIPLLNSVGVRVMDMGQGLAAVEADLAGNHNHVGMMYAGSMFCLAEVLGGLVPAATWDLDGYAPIAAELTIRFVAPAFGRVSARATVSDDVIARVRDELAAGVSSVWFDLDTTLVGEAGEELARTSGRYVLRRLEGTR